MNEEFFRERLAILRMNKGVSAREMSLAMGQNPGYINSIEMGKTFPSMAGFFYICEYLGITPREFFDTDTTYPEETRELVGLLGKIDKKYIEIFISIAKGLLGSNAALQRPDNNTDASPITDELPPFTTDESAASKKEHDEINKLYFKMLSSCEPSEAMNNIGMMYMDGIGVPKKHKEAFRWFSMAAAMGSRDAKENLEKMV